MAGIRKTLRNGREALLLQLPVPAFASQAVTGNIPLAGADLVLHARTQKSGSTLEPLLFPRESQNRSGDSALVRQVLSRKPAAVGLTCNVWNIERSLHLAGQIKRHDPGIKIWLGGPEIAGDAYFIQDKDAPFDIAVEGEGEEVFQALIAGKSPGKISGLLLPGGNRTAGKHKPCLLADLNSIHDPYLAGLVAPEADKSLFAEFYRGCRYGCHFCRYHQGRKGKGAARSYENTRNLLRWAREEKVSQIYVLDPSMEQRPDLDPFLDFLARENRFPQIPLFVELRADRIDNELVRKLLRAGVREAEIGLQTASPATLKRLGRATDLSRFVQGAEALKKAGIRLQVDIMLGLPGEGMNEINRTLSFLLRHHLDSSAQVFRTQVFPGTRLRKRASVLGLEYEPRPPYFALSTRSLSNEKMENAFAVAEKRLNVRFDPETRPLIRMGNPKAMHPGTNAVYYSFYNLDVPRQRKTFSEEEFGDAANSCTLHIRAADPNREAALIAEVLRKFISANPFSSLCVLLDHVPGVALDIYDRLAEVMRENTLSKYLERLYGREYMDNVKSRRLFSALPSSPVGAIYRGWLSSLREVSGVIWVKPCNSAAEALDAASSRSQPAPDYLYLDIAEGKIADRKSFLSKLAGTAADPFGVILPGTDLHWEYVRLQEESAKVRE